ncbi:MAG: hypothetical protein Q9M31_02955 [Mariprofundus sp.]|nr:hypothetical protein [Mariprofundus sp.]
MVKNALISLYFNVWLGILRNMLRRKLNSRGLSRLMAGLFALQIVLTGFCLLTPEAHAMPMPTVHSTSAHTGDVDGHCAKAENGQHSSGHSDSCYHCDQPDQLSNQAPLTFAHVVLLLPVFLIEPAVQTWHSLSGLLSVRTPTGPPRSSTLLYTTSQRILI